MLRLAGKQGLPLIISEVLRNMELKLVNVLEPYVKELVAGMPQSSKLPIHDYGTEGGYGYFQLKLKDILTLITMNEDAIFIIFIDNCKIFSHILTSDPRLCTTSGFSEMPWFC